MAIIYLKNATNITPVSILIAEDDIDDQELLAQALQSLNPDVNAAFITNGNAFRLHLEKLEDDCLPKVILLDYNLPEMSGVEILKLLRGNARYRQIPKMIWSTSNSSIFKNQSVEFGAVDYFVKPSDFDSFTVIAKKILEYV